MVPIHPVVPPFSSHLRWVTLPSTWMLDCISGGEAAWQRMPCRNVTCKEASGRFGNAQNHVVFAKRIIRCPKKEVKQMKQIMEMKSMNDR